MHEQPVLPVAPLQTKRNWYHPRLSPLSESHPQHWLEELCKQCYPRGAKVEPNIYHKVFARVQAFEADRQGLREGICGTGSHFRCKGGLVRSEYDRRVH